MEKHNTSFKVTRLYRWQQKPGAKIDLEEFTRLVYQGLNVKQIQVKMLNKNPHNFGFWFKLQHNEYPSVYIHKIKEQMKHGKGRTTKSANITT